MIQIALTSITVLLGILYAGLLWWYRAGWYKALAHARHHTKPVANDIVVSVIVPARNEEGFIGNCLQSLADQQYPQNLMEVVVIDDESEDDTRTIAKRFAAGDTRFKVITPQWPVGTTAYKKRAIEAGIAACSGELVICTDADCTHHPLWISTLVNAYAGGANKFVAAPVVYSTESTLLSVFQTLDFLTLQGITAASVTLRLHSMCNGANIAYSKAVFDEVGGFAGIDKLPTGDDMLLMHKIQSRYPMATTYCLDENAMVTTHAPSSWRAFLQQRIRWASKAAYYQDRRIFWVLLLVYFINVWLLLLSGLWVYSTQYLSLALGAWLGKTIIELALVGPVAAFFGKNKWLPWFPLLQPIHVVYTVMAGWLGYAGSYTWKGRTTGNKPG